MLHKIQIISCFIVVRSLIFVNGFSVETRYDCHLPESDNFFKINTISNTITKWDLTENNELKNSSKNLYQFIPYAVISGTDSICPGETTYLSVRLIQGTPPWSFTYSINGKKYSTISGINDTEYMLEATQEGTYKLTSVKDANRRGFGSGEGKVFFKDIPEAVLSGGGEVCEGVSINLRLDLTGTPPFMIKYRNDNSASGTVENIMSSLAYFGVKAAGNYTLTEVSDKYCRGTFSGSAAVSLLPAPEVSIEGLGTTYSIDSDPVPIFGYPEGGVFVGEGLIFSKDTIFFLPSWAGTENSPYIILYSWQDPGNGCIGKDSVIVDVLEVEADIIFPENKTLFCFDDEPFNIQGLNVNNVIGHFTISGNEGLVDNGDNTATIDPTALNEGEYEITYRYFDKTWFEYTELFEVEYVTPIWLIGFERNTFCNNENPVPLNGNIEEGVFHGRGVTGNTSMGFSYLPSLVDNNRDTIFYTYTTANGCDRQIFEAVTINPAPIVRFNMVDSCIQYGLGDSIEFINITVSSDSILGWFWDFDDIGSGQSNFSILESPRHLFTTAGTKYITLSAETDRGCLTSEEIRINLGYYPQADFNWNTECLQPDQPVYFSNKSTTEIGILEKFEWQIELADTLEIHNSENISFTFPEPGTYNINFITGSNYGCFDTATIPFSLRPVIQIADDPYFEDFETGKNGWGVSLSSEEEWNSWVFGKSESDFPGQEPGMNYWYTSISQGVKETSWIISPCFDFSNCTGPMIKFNGWRSFYQKRDGVVMQYKDNDGKEWYNIGDLNDGINWYNSYAIQGKPGGQSIGWSDNIRDNRWIEMRHDLDSLLGKSLVQFRIAYGSEGTYSDDNKGFAFDDIWIGERKKVVLLEHFTNSADSLSKQANNILYDVINAFNKDVINLQYHTSFPGEDPFNRDNPIVSEVRIFYYGILTVPYTLLDGGINNMYRFDYYFKNLSKKDIILQSLTDPAFRLNVRTEYNTGNVGIEVEIEAIDSVSLRELTLHIAVIENEITGVAVINGEQRFQDVVKALVPDPAGTYIYKSWKPGDYETLFYTWEYDKVYDVSQLRVVAFIQDEQSKEIYQSAIDKYEIVSSAADKSVAGREHHFIIVPNPAADYSQIWFEFPLVSDCYLSVYSMEGRVISNDIIKSGTLIYRLDTKSYAQGLYVIKIFSDKDFLESKRILINRMQY
jgi:hypothetical protein